MRRLVGVALLVAGAVGIGDGYRETHRWLDEQSIVVAVTETNPYYEDLELRGEIHAELDPEASTDEVEAFARDAAEFLADRDTYEVDLSAGRGGVDLAIRDVDDVAGRMAVWSSLEGDRVAGARAVLVGAYRQRADAGPLVTTRVASADSAAVLAELESRALPETSLELQGVP